MQIIRTELLGPDGKYGNRFLDPVEQLLVYNGLDNCVTYEVLDALLPQLNPTTQTTYNFSRSLQGPILEMNMRGVLIDEERRQEVIKDYQEKSLQLAGQLDSILRDGIGFEFSIAKNRKNPWPSNQQLCDLFYKVLGLPTVYKRNAEGERVPTVDRDALEKLEHYFYAEPIVRHLYTLRDLGKKLSFLNTEIDSDRRVRTSFNIAGTNTGRLASSFSYFGTGTNLQNVENILRSVFIADPGYKFCNIDLEQADSRGVGAIQWNLFRDGRYLDTCESGDLHTSVARDGFPELLWTGDLKSDRKIADDNFYRQFSYRDASKRLGHGTNYKGQAEKMARATHIPLQNVKAFQTNYLKKYPAFPLWWEWVERQIRDVRKITTLLGRQRYFFGHYRDDDTIRQAIAYEPQSITADTIDRGLLELWRRNIVQLLLQVHDSLLFQYREEDEEQVVPLALSIVGGQRLLLKDEREFVIPAEAKVGWNWADFHSEKNPDPDSMRKYNDSNRPSKRTRKPSASVLDRWL